MTRNQSLNSTTSTTGTGYRQRWQWDSHAWGTHCVDCYPGNCLYRVYVRDGQVVREEPSGTMPVLVPGTPDRNPMGCQKGAGWSKTLSGEERVLYPLKRAGERGEGRWQRVSWDTALGEIAGSILETIESEGPESVLRITSAAEGGITAGWSASRLFSELLGLNATDVNGDINDFSHGQFITWGKFHNAVSPESKFQSELILFWYSNPAYTGIPLYHFISEARYRGAEVVLIAPDCSPSHSHADYFIPVRIGTDAALVLSMCRVILDEGLFDSLFIREQTDLPLLVRRDNGRFLRECDLREGGRENQFYWLGADGSARPAPRGSLASPGAEPLLSGAATVE
ncbi:ethylbenzene dehydrogenase, partial [bacterium]